MLEVRQQTRVINWILLTSSEGEKQVLLDAGLFNVSRRIRSILNSEVMKNKFASCQNLSFKLDKHRFDFII